MNEVLDLTPGYRKAEFQYSQMITRISKLLLLIAISAFYSLVVFNNVTDFDSNYQLVRHVLMMDTTFPHNGGMWRAVPSPIVHRIFYILIIGWEVATMVILWVGSYQLIRQLRDSTHPAPYGMKRVGTVLAARPRNQRLGPRRHHRSG